MHEKIDVGMGLFVQCLYALSLHLVSVVFGTAIPTSLYIFGKCFIYLFRVSYRGGAPWDFPPPPPEFQDCTMIYQ